MELVQAELPAGADLDRDRWELVRDPNRPRRALRLVEPARRGAWDSAGMQSPSYATGIDGSGAHVERVYYAGRASRQTTGPRSRYPIGALERRDGTWQRLPGR